MGLPLAIFEFDKGLVIFLNLGCSTFNKIVNCMSCSLFTVLCENFGNSFVLVSGTSC